MIGERENGAWTNYVWFAGELVSMTRGGAIYQIDNDHLGRPELITNANKAVVWQSNNDPFGGMTTTTNTLGEFNIGLPGQYFDAESNYWYNVNRYYVPAIGRYLQADPVGLAGGSNPYTYVNNNPAMWIDPTGRNGILTAELGAEGGFLVCGPACAVVGAGIGLGIDQHRDDPALGLGDAELETDGLALVRARASDGADPPPLVGRQRILADHHVIQVVDDEVRRADAGNALHRHRPLAGDQVDLLVG